jgi:tetraacyldisaccharide 4'-kinase
MMVIECLVVDGLLEKIINMNFIDKIACYIQHSLWSKVTLINYLLLPLSAIYSLFRNLRYYFFQTPIKFKSKIVCVGNSISGGAGKTPVVIRLVELLSQDNKLDIAVVARGYKGNLSKKVVKVNLKKHSYKEVGDEALLIAEYTTVFISKNRKLAIRMAEKNGAKIIILDDGFQDNSIHKDFSILVISTNIFKPQTNTFLIPAGPMRESLKTSIGKADIIITSDENHKLAKHKLIISKELFHQQQVIKNKEEIKNKEFVLLCGIAQPERVEKTAKNLNAKIIKKYFFPDHYNFSLNELEEIYDEAKKFNCKVLTTKKDFVRINSKFHCNTVVIDYSIEFNDEDRLIKKLLT